MRLSPEEIAAAVKLHDFVRGFEKTRVYQAWGPAWPGVVTAFSINSRWILESHHRDRLIYFAAAMVVFSFLLVVMQRLTKSRYERDRVLLQVLERERADELPWIEEERMEARVKAHLAAVGQIQREVALNHG
jgi:hypothetical protein